MQMVSPSSLAYLVIQSHIRLHNWTLNYILIFFLFQGLSLGEIENMLAILQLVGDRLQQVAVTIW
jgi:hypothetical protein